MSIRPFQGRRRPIRMAAIAIGLGLVLAACASEERSGIRLTPTSTVDAGVRVIVDNCPGPEAVTLLVRDEVLWRIEAPAQSVEGDESASISASPPALREFLVGETPTGWNEIQHLDTSLTIGVRYTVVTRPDGQSIDFSVPDLATGLLFDGIGNSQFNSRLMLEPCSEPADVGLFARNMLILVALWVTAAALVMVSIILVLFVITRRFSRIRAIQRRMDRDLVVDDQELTEVG
ncbi:MAG: hypothetical protein ACR2P0_05885 [Acidimicrobiales bacterium]